MREGVVESHLSKGTKGGAPGSSVHARVLVLNPSGKASDTWALPRISLPLISPALLSRCIRRQSAHLVPRPDLSLRRNAFKFIHCWQEFICTALSHGA
jgi:hypothetical protein